MWTERRRRAPNVAPESCPPTARAVGMTPPDPAQEQRSPCSVGARPRARVQARSRSSPARRGAVGVQVAEHRGAVGGLRTRAGRPSGRRPSRSGQRVWKRQPGGGAAGDGMSPSSTMRSRSRCRTGFGTGIAESSASVYGCFGRAYTSSAGPCSTIRPRYITAMRSLTWRTTARSCAMKRYASPSSSWRSPSRLMTCGLGRHVERAHRLVEHQELRRRARARARSRRAAADHRRTRAGTGCGARGRGRPCAAARRTCARVSPLASGRGSLRIGSAMLSAIVASGSNDEYGSWNTICMPRAELAELACRAAR